MAPKRKVEASSQTLLLFPPSAGAPLEREGGAVPSARGGGKHSLRAPLRELPPYSDLPPSPPGVYFGTSSWNYPGWTGQVYARSYKSSGDATGMLEEYVRCPLFSCVGVDATFYRAPSREMLRSYASILPPGFQALGKVHERYTVRQHANHPRLGALAGKLNSDFLNASLCTESVVGPWLEELGDRAGPLLFEFQTQYPPHRPSPGAWAEQLFNFFRELPKVGRYAVEMRNPELLTPEYFQALRQTGVAHLFNAWTRMPGIGEQLALEGSLTAPFVVSRALLRKGRVYDEAVDQFSPYDHIQEEQPEVRQALVDLILRCIRRGLSLYVLVNNRLEGNAPSTIEAIRRLVAPLLEKGPEADDVDRS